MQKHVRSGGLRPNLKNLRIEKLTGKSIDRLYGASNRLVFFHPDWIAAAGAKKVFAAFAGDELVGGAWFYEFGKLGLKIVCNAPCTPYSPVFIVKDLLKDKDQRSEVINQLLNAGSKPLMDIGLSPEMSAYEVIEKNFVLQAQLTQVLSLTFSEQEMLASFSASTRNKINKVAQHPYGAAFNEDPESAISCYSETMRRVGKSFDRKMFDYLLSPEANGLAFYVNIYSSGKIAASCLVGFDAHVAYYIAAGRSIESDQVAGTLAVWEAIRHAKSLGIARFDFCGSSIPGVARFFKSFGAKTQPCVRASRGVVAQDTLKFLNQKLRSK